LKIASKEVLKFVLGLKIKSFRSNFNLSLKELANKSGLSVSYLNEIEKGKKYPTMEKLMALSHGLKIPIEKLVSLKVDKNLSPLLEFLESDFLKGIPLDLFGINSQNLNDLMSYSPENFSSLIITLMEIAKSYDMKLEDLYLAALRSYQEINNNFFPDIEKSVKKLCEVQDISNFDNIKTIDLENILVNKFNYVIDYETISMHTELNSLRCLIKPGSPNKLLINEKLNDGQIRFILAREIGNFYMNLQGKNHSVAGSGIEINSFQQVLDDYKSSYFSGALLLNKANLYSKLKEFFSKDTFDTNSFLSLMNGYDVSSEMFLHRMTQLLPEYFKINQLFFLRFNTHQGSGRYKISKELHLSKLHRPHGIGLNEHYCRRWITVSLLKNLENKIRNNEYDSEKPLIALQRSVMVNDSGEYLCLSLARQSNLKEDGLTCITIGMLVNDNLKRHLKFYNEDNIPMKKVSQTCERCPIDDCKERVATNSIYVKEIEKEKKSRRIDALLESL